MAEVDGGTDRKGIQFVGEDEFFRGSSKMALRHLYEETLDINFNDESALLATRTRSYVGGSLTDLSLITAEGSRSEVAVIVYGDPIRKAQLRVLDTHLAAAKQ